MRTPGYLPTIFQPNKTSFANHNYIDQDLPRDTDFYIACARVCPRQIEEHILKMSPSFSQTDVMVNTLTVVSYRRLKLTRTAY